MIIWAKNTFAVSTFLLAFAFSFISEAAAANLPIGATYLDGKPMSLVTHTISPLRDGVNYRIDVSYPNSEYLTINYNAGVEGSRIPASPSDFAQVLLDAERLGISRKTIDSTINFTLSAIREMFTRSIKAREKTTTETPSIEINLATPETNVSAPLVMTSVQLDGIKIDISSHVIKPLEDALYVTTFYYGDRGSLVYSSYLKNNIVSLGVTSATKLNATSEIIKQALSDVKAMVSRMFDRSIASSSTSQSETPDSSSDPDQDSGSGSYGD